MPGSQKVGLEKEGEGMFRGPEGEPAGVLQGRGRGVKKKETRMRWREGEEGKKTEDPGRTVVVPSQTIMYEVSLIADTPHDRGFMKEHDRPERRE